MIRFYSLEHSVIFFLTCNALVWSVLGLYGLHGSEGCGFVAVYIKKEKRKKKVNKKKKH